ncbi:MAG: hypothetical protein K0R46_2280 [Herbinix sp.]|jgi:sortase A|nr:hypothetical protein [Herbinix sp.]
MKNKLIRIMAYVYMPLLFVLVGYSFIYYTAAPGIRLWGATLEMVLSDEVTDYHPELKTIYNPESKKNELTVQEEKSTFGIGTVYQQENRADAVSAEVAIDIIEIQIPEMGTHYAMLSCDRINLEVPVYWGDTMEILNAGVGQFMGSFLPGFERSILMSAHNTTFFKPLELVQIGDVIACSTNYGEYEYCVDQVEIISAEEAERKLDDMLSLREEKLILYTCYPFHSYVGNKDKRLFVYANKRSGPRVEY